MASELFAVQLIGRALRRRLLLTRMVLCLGGRERQSGEPGGERGRNRNPAGTHGGLPGWIPRAKTSKLIRHAKQKPTRPRGSGLAPKKSVRYGLFAGIDPGVSCVPGRPRHARVDGRADFDPHRLQNERSWSKRTAPQLSRPLLFRRQLGIPMHGKKAPMARDRL